MDTRASDFDLYRVSRSRLAGTVRVSGAKNSVLQLLAGSLLTGEEVILENHPSGILDAQVKVAMLERLGKTCVVTADGVRITETKRIEPRLEWDGRSIRTTLLLLGSMVARNGEGAVPLPGGCQLGDRKFDLHEMVLRTLGAEVTAEHGMLVARAPRRLRGADIHLPLRSTGATQNAILCGTLAKGRTRIWNPHVRPETLDLVAFLNTLGAKIQVHGQEHIEIEGVDGLRGGRHRVVPDNMEALTWLIASVVTGGDIEILDFPWAHLEVPLIHLRESGARFYRCEDALIVRGGRCLPVEISTGPFPGINSDMQPLFAVYAACGRGESRIVDLRFAGRYGYAAEMEKMGVRSEVDGLMLRIHGGSAMRGATVKALDLRAGVALTIAGFCADGETRIQDAWQVERGYDRFVDKLTALGGRIARE